MQHPLVIEAQYRGPPESGNGGYVAGAVADRFFSDNALHEMPSRSLCEPQ